MAKTTTFTFRLNPKVKQDAGELFESLGITMSDTINLFLHRAIQEEGIPFEIKKTNDKKIEITN